VCDNAAGESCPLWPGTPVTDHWGFPDPSQVQGGDAEKRLAFAEVMNGLKNKIDQLASLPLDTFDAPGIRAELKRLGKA
jgi:protein-tyrosine-phosphatase